MVRNVSQNEMDIEIEENDQNKEFVENRKNKNVTMTKSMLFHSDSNAEMNMIMIHTKEFTLKMNQVTMSMKKKTLWIVMVQWLASGTHTDDPSSIPVRLVVASW